MVSMALAGTSSAGAPAGLMDPRGREHPRLQPAVRVRRHRFDRQRPLLGAQARRDEADLRVERLARIGIDGQRDRQTGLDQRDRLFRHGQLQAQRVDADDRGHVRAAGHVVADADDALRDQAGERRPDVGVRHRLAGHRDARPRRLERTVGLLGRVQRDLILLPGGLDLRAALVVLALRDHLLIEQRLDAVELRFGVVERRLGVHHLRHLGRLERLVRRQPEPRLNLRRVRLGFLQLRRGLGRGDAGQQRTGLDARAALDRNRDHPAGGLGTDFGLFIGDQRAGDAEIAIDRPALDRGDRDGHGGGRSRRRFGAHVGAARGERRQDGEERNEDEGATYGHDQLPH